MAAAMAGDRRQRQRQRQRQPVFRASRGGVVVAEGVPLVLGDEGRRSVYAGGGLGSVAGGDAGAS